MATLKISSVLQNVIKKVVLDAYYPIGRLYLTVGSEDPNTTIGGTWVRFGTGKTLVGVDTSDGDFNSVEKTGGSKYLQKHNHTQNPHYHQFKTNEYDPVSVLYDSGSNQWYGVGSFGGYKFSAKNLGISEVTATNNPAGTGNSENLQPYITVYMWKRIK